MVDLPHRLQLATQQRMAPPKRVAEVLFLRDETHSSGELSVAEDSSWRDLDAQQVAEYVKLIMEGNWGLTSLAPPSLIADVGNVMVAAVDGELLLYNGKQIIAALAQVQSKFSQISEDEVRQASWRGEGLLTIL